MVEKYTPCDSGECPYNAISGMQCYWYCGLGVDEDVPEQGNAE